jgi:hypothetical protein
MTSSTVIPWFMSWIRSSKIACKGKTLKTKINFQEEVSGTTIGLWEEGACISENWLGNWKTGINLCISYKRKLTNQLLVFWGITILKYFSFVRFLQFMHVAYMIRMKLQNLKCLMFISILQSLLSKISQRLLWRL